MKSILNKTVLLAVLIGLGFSFMSFDDEDERMFALGKNMQIFAKLYKELSESYVDQVEPAQLMKTGLDGMLKALDPYTNYISGARIEQAKLEQGTVGNVGLKMISQDGRIIVSEVIEGMGANKAGVKAGDEIVEVGGKQVSGKKVEDIELILKGQPDSQIEMGFVPSGAKKTSTKQISRTTVPPRSVTFYKMYNDSIGYIKLDQFTRQCGNFVQKGIKELQKDDKLKQLIFDLRGNPGGLLQEAILISNMFTPKDAVVVTTKGRKEASKKEFKGPNEPAFPDIPVVVLTSGKSASASEIVSGVLQDYDRGVVMGERTYGKGLVQNTKDIGFNSRLKLTISKYYLPSGRCIQAIDYYGNYTDEGAKEIPDSLKQSFKTINAGRTVYDAGGVKPDVLVEPETKSDFIEQIKSQHILFEFVNDFVSKHDSIAAPEDFILEPQVLADFKSFLEEKNASFESETESAIDKMQELVEEENLSEDIKTLLESMEAKIDAYQQEGVSDFDQALSKELKSEIASRYYYQRGRTEALLYEDPLIAKAAALLADGEAYRNLLK